VRVAHLVPAGIHPYSGVLTALVSLAGALSGRGIELELWQVGAWPSGAEELERRLADLQVRRVEFDGAFSRTWPGTDRNTAREMARRRVDVVHFHGVFHPFNVQVARALRVPYVISPHGGYAPESLTYHAGRKRLFRTLFEAPMLRRASVVCALTSAEAGDVRRFCAGTTIAVVANGVDAPPACVDAARFRATLGVRPGERLALYVGRMDVRAKRLDHLIRGTGSAAGWRVALIGGDFRNGVAEARSIARQERVEDRVYVLAPRRGNALHEALAAADLFVLLSRSEGLPMALLEAASHGVPSLVSPEVERSVAVVEAGAAWTADPERVGEAMMELARLNDVEWVRKRTRAFAFAARFRWDEVAVQYENIYRRAIGCPAPPGFSLSDASSLRTHLHSAE
jgi:glycosyltransferase involved in cell wall biosynthesis